MASARAGDLETWKPGVLGCRPQFASFPEFQLSAPSGGPDAEAPHLQPDGGRRAA